MPKEYSIRNYIFRLAILTAGLFIMAMGIVFCIRADLGITPISCPPYVLSLGLSPTVGQFTILMHLLLILGQALLLGRDFHGLQWLQIALALVFGCFIDDCMQLTTSMVPANYLQSILFLLAGNVLMAVGMNFEIKAHIILVPTDGFVQAVCRKTGRSFSQLKIVFDISLLAISIACSLILLGRIEGVREGTLISAFLVGFLLGLIRHTGRSSGQ